MDAIETILTRRSIRRYIKKSIPYRHLQELLEAAVSAPSASNEQPWHFIIIDDKEIFNEITKFHPNAEMLKEADKAILVCADTNLEKNKGYFPLDCSAATENILLAAHSKGLGACWLGIYPREERIVGMRELLHIPEHVVPFSLVSLGYPNEEKPRDERYDSSRVHYNKW